MKIYRFYKDEGIWFINLKYFPKIFKHHLAMVAGADLLLDLLSDSKDEVSLIINCKHEIPKCPIEFEVSGKLTKLNFSLGLFGGRIYDVKPSMISSNADYLHIESICGHNRIWLCWVTLLVFFKYPKIIYFKVVY